MIHKWFPINLEKCRGLPINAHPGAFGCARRHNFHEGIDLYGDPQDPVYCIAEGEVILNERFTGPDVGYPWWLNTDAVLVKDEEGYWVYGELKSELKVGDRVKKGDIIGRLTPVLPPEKLRKDIPEHSVTMLHLERYSLEIHVETQYWASWEHWDSRPDYLLDPTPILIDILRSKSRYPKFLTF